MLSETLRVFLLVLLLVAGNARHIDSQAVSSGVADLRIERLGRTVNLLWTHSSSAAVEYEVWRSKTPYATSPPDAVRLGVVTPGAAPPATVNYRDWGSADGVAQVNYSYFVRAVDAQGQVFEPSNRVGDFDFALQDRSIWQPQPGTSWQWQLSGEIDTSFDVQMYDIDLEETAQSVIDGLHAAGRKVICYFSAGSWENYRSDAGDFPDSVLGNVMDGWPDERWLDIRQLEVLSPIMERRLDLAVQKRCDGVEPDNIEGYTNDTGFAFTYLDQQIYNTWLAKAAHSRNLSIGLKNDLGQIDDLLPFFDWALNEQCFQYDECDPLDAFVADNKAVFGVEYSLNTTDFCPAANARDFDWLKKRLNLGPWRVACR